MWSNLIRTDVNLHEFIWIYVNSNNLLRIVLFKSNFYEYISKLNENTMS
jgi:hypothetical protein